MLDYNHRPKFQERVGAVIDEALARERASQTPRRYLGASRLGVACERALQYEYAQAPVDSGRELPGRVLRVFEGPAELELACPALWECKTMNDKSWRETVKQGVAAARPIYAAQLAVYQAYMEGTVPGIASNPALFTAINKDSEEIWFELVPFDGGLALRMSDRAVRVISATEAGELLPRHATTPTHFECKSCPWQDRCWRPA